MTLKNLEPRLFGWAGFTLTVLVAIGGAWTSAKMGVKEQADINAKQDERITVMESVMHDFVPRNEHEAHWKAMENRLDSIQSDVREIRARQK